LALLRLGLLAGSAHCDESILDLPEGHQDRLPVLGHGLLGLGLSRLTLPRNVAPRANESTEYISIRHHRLA